MSSARRVLGVGHPRGGTRYVSRLLMAAGCRALHEANGRDGSVSCWLAFDDWWHPHQQANGLRKDFTGFVLLHIVRHPLAAIASMREFKHAMFWHWQQVHTGLRYEPESTEFFARFWLEWNRRISRQRPFATLRIEKPEDAWPVIAETLALPKEMPSVEVDPTWTNPKKQPVTWRDLGECEDEVRSLAESYGYKENA